MVAEVKTAYGEIFHFNPAKAMNGFQDISDPHYVKRMILWLYLGHRKLGMYLDGDILVAGLDGATPEKQ